MYSLAVTKVIKYGNDVICLLNDTNGDPQSLVKRVTFYEDFSRQETLLSFGVFVTDLTITENDTMFLVDALGNFNSVKFNDARLKGSIGSYNSYLLDDCLDIKRTVTPHYIIGEDKNLWIITVEGLIINYDSSVFTVHLDMGTAALLKEVDGRYFVMGHTDGILELIGDEWIKIKISEHGITGDQISDLTICNGNIIAVSRLGFILVSIGGAPFKVLHLLKDVSWYGCDTLNGIVYLAAGKHGSYTLSNAGLIKIKDRGNMLSVTVIGDSIVYICGENSKYGFVRYMPFNNDKWVLVKTC